MARKIFFAASGQNCGKTTVSLSLLHRAQKKYKRVGFMKPISPKPELLRGLTVDKDAVLMCQVFGLGRDLDYMSPVVIEGAGHPGVGSVVGLSNAHVARMLNAQVMMVTGGGVEKGMEHDS